jgi:hypothetical protein
MLTIIALAALSVVSWDEGSLIPNDYGGTNCRYIDTESQLEWQHRCGDWIDSEGTYMGDVPWAQFPLIISQEPGGWYEIDITRLAQAWQNGEIPNEGVLIQRIVNGTAPVQFSAREGAHPPELVITYADGSETLTATADTSFYNADVSPMGRDAQENLGGATHRGLIRWDTPRAPVAAAVMRLWADKVWYGGSGGIGVFAAAPRHTVQTPAVVAGWASGMTMEEARQAPQAILVETFDESGLVDRGWRNGDKNESRLVDGWIRATFPEGSYDGGNGAVTVSVWHVLAGGEPPWPPVVHLGYRVQFSDPFEAYRLASPVGGTSGGGKLPGFGGKYNPQTDEFDLTGGQSCVATNPPSAPGHSSRGGFGPTRMAGPRESLIPIGVFTSDIDGYARCRCECQYAATQYTSRDWAGGLLEPGREYWIEMQIEMNTPGKTDGCVREWVDGRPALEQCGLRWIEDSKYGTTDVWLNGYYGGRGASPIDQFVQFDDVIISTEYIGVPDSQAPEPEPKCPVESVLIEGVPYVCGG